MASLSDLELEVDKPSRMTILDPATNLPMQDKAGKQAFIDVYSADSEIARKFRREIKTSRLRARNPNALNGDKLEAEDVQLLAALTAGWYLVTRAGEPIEIECTRENAAKIYANHKMAWLADQVDAHAGSRGNFSKPSSTSSAPSASGTSSSTDVQGTAQPSAST
jgi:hypothetical protein